MPHLLIESPQLPPLPAEVEGVKFLFKAGEMIGVESGNYRYFLKLIPKGENRYLLKYEKKTRPLLKELKKGYLAFLQLTEARVIRENISGIKEKPLSPYLKKIEEDFSDIDIVEIGFGTGRHLIHLAREYPEKTILGVEIYNPAIEQVLRRVKVEGISNIRVINYDARLLLSRIPSNRLEAIYLHFPVPWDDKPHRRVINRPFLNEVFRSLKVGGIFHLRTDSENYFRYTLEQLLTYPRIEFQTRKNFNYKTISKYEERWKKLGKSIFDIIISNWEESPPNRQQWEFEFGKRLCNWSFKPLVYDRFVIHIEKVYPMEGGGELVQGSIGAFDRVERVFIVNKEKPYYFRPPAPIEENFLAHQELKRVFKCR